MKLATVKTTTTSYRTYTDMLIEQGYLMIGSGLFAEVYSKKGCDHVIKVGCLRSINGWHTDGYVGFLRRLDLSNPLFPAITQVERFALVEKNVVSSRYYVVKMERLIEYHNIRSSAREAALNKIGVESVDEFEESTGRRGGPFKSNVVNQAHRILQALWSKYSSDLHTGNVMWREIKANEYQLVITDPATGKFGYNC